MSRSTSCPLEREEEYIGQKSEVVPQADPGEYCNAKKTKQDDDRTTIFTGYCQAEAGKGTEHLGDGRCKHHGGAIRDGSPGAPKGNLNGLKHGLNADPFRYHRSLPGEQKEYIRDVSATIEDRIQARTGELDHLDRIMARRLAIELHIVSKATDYVLNESGLTEASHGSHEKKAALLGEIRKRDDSIMQDLKRLGALDDPESQQAEELEQWQEILAHRP